MDSYFNLKESQLECPSNLISLIENGKKVYLLVAIWTDTGCFIISFTIIIRTVVEGSVSAPDRPAPLLILEVPVEAGEGSVLLAFMLQKQGALLHTKLLQIPATKM